MPTPTNKDIYDLAKKLRKANGYIESIKEQDAADKVLGDACNQAWKDPTAENLDKLRKAHEDWYHLPAEQVGKEVTKLIPGGVGAALSAVKLNPLGDKLKELQDSPGNSFSQARLEKAAKLLNGNIFSEFDLGRCAKAGVYFNQAQTPPATPKDPLAIDLDGDGIETIGSTAGAKFDHDGDGIRTGTGWVAGDDGLIVLDRNHNGRPDYVSKPDFPRIERAGQGRVRVSA